MTATDRSAFADVTLKFVRQV